MTWSWGAAGFALALAALYIPGHMAEIMTVSPVFGNTVRFGPIPWAFLFLAGSTGIGTLFLRITGQSVKGLAMRIFLAAGLGAGLLSCLVVAMMAAGLAGLAGRTAMIAAAAIPALSLLVTSSSDLRLAARASAGLTSRHPLLVLAVLSFVVVNLAGSLVPMTSYDDQVYHLPLARSYASRGVMIPDGSISQAYKPFLGLPPFIWAHIVCPYGGNPDPAIVCQVIHALFGVLAALGCFAGAGFVSSLFAMSGTGHGISLAAVLFFLSTPQVAILSASAYVDLLETSLELVAVLSLAMALSGSGNETADPGNETRHLVNSGIAGGLAAGVKYTMLYSGVAAACAILALSLVRHGRRGAQETGPPVIERGVALKSVAVFGVVAALIVAPFFAWTWYFTGNPVFPHFSGIFPGHLADEASSGLMRMVESPGFEYFKGRFGPERTLAGVLTLPVTLFTDSYIHTRTKSLRYFDGMLSPQVLMGLGFLIIPAFRQYNENLSPAGARSVVPFLALFSVIRFAVWASGTLQVRFLFPLLPVLAVLSAFGIGMALEKSRKPGLAVVITACLVMGFNLFFSVFRHCEKGVIDYMTGAVEREQYLSSRLPFYENFKYINENLPVRARVAPLYEPRIYYLERPVKWCGEMGIWPVNVFYGSDSAAEVVGRFKNMGIEYLFLPVHGVKFLHEILLGAGNPDVEGYSARLEEFFKIWVDFLYYDKYGAVFRIRRKPLGTTGEESTEK